VCFLVSIQRVTYHTRVPDRDFIATESQYALLDVNQTFRTNSESESARWPNQWQVKQNREAAHMSMC